MPFHINFTPGSGFDSSGFGGFNNSGDGTTPPTPPRRPKKQRKPRKAIGNGFTRILINLLVTLLFGLIYFYVELPALNFQSQDIYVFMFLLCAVYCVSAIFTSGFQGDGAKGYLHFVKKQCTVPFSLVIAMERMRLSSNSSGTSPRAIFLASPSAIAVLPTPGSPIRTGLFFVRRDRI